MTVSEVQTNELWMLNPVMRRHVLNLADEFVEAHDAGDREVYRAVVIQMDGVFEGYFMAQGLEVPPSVVNELRKAAISEARSAQAKAAAWEAMV